MKIREYLFEGIWDYIVTWPKRQPWKDIPMLLALVGTACFAYAMIRWNPETMKGRYSEAANTALGKGDAKRAIVACQRLMAIDPSMRLPSLFGMAVAYQSLGQFGRVAELMQVAAPSDKPGFAPAHLYYARLMLQQPNGLQTFFPAIKAQLDQVLAMDEDSVEAHEMLGNMYASLGDWELAKTHFSSVTKSKPEYLLVLSRLAEKAGNTKAALNWARDAKVWFLKSVQDSPEDVPKDRIAAVEAMTLLKEYEEAQKVLGEGVARSGVEPYRTVIPKVSAGLAESLATKHPTNPGARIPVLREGFDAVPSDPAVIAGILALSEENGLESGELGDRMLRVAEKPGAWQPLGLLAAKIAWNRGDSESAGKWLEKVSGQGAEGVTMVVDFANAASARSPQVALMFAEFAVTKRPDDAKARMARGVAYMALQRLPEALVDFQFALDHSDDQLPVHKAFVTAYRLLGMENLAMDHMRSVNQIVQAAARPAGFLPAPDPGSHAGKPTQ